MSLVFGREICGHLETARAREWLVTNGIGGFASGTIAGLLTRRYHGLLFAALQPPVGRTLLLAKLDETIEYDGIYPESGRFHPLYVNHWSDDTIEPNGYYNINQFHLEGTTAVWTYAIANALLEKRIWMEPGANTTYIHYTLTRATGPLRLEAKALANMRDYHSTTLVDELEPVITPIKNGLHMQMDAQASPFYLLSQDAILEPHHEWFEDFYLSIEDYRGQNDIDDDHVHVANIKAELRPGESFTMVATTEPEVAKVDPNELLAGAAALARRQSYEQGLLDKASHNFSMPLPEPIKHLTLAADQFIVQRPTQRDPNGRSIIAGYHWFSDWGRDTMIALPGLTLVTGRAEIAASVLRTYAEFVDMGMIPNRFPDAGERPEYNTVDATLWYFQAINAYYAATADTDLLRDLYPILQEIIKWHKRGTRYSIYMDEKDGLLFAGEEGVQLTWMDAKVDNWVVTPRVGKPVEINALWYNALRILAQFADLLGEDGSEYGQMAENTAVGFRRFWYETMGYCYDVIDGPDGIDGRLRPNQLFAISLPYSPLTPEQQRSIVDACARHLLTPHGLRSLSADDPEYVGHYGGDQYTRDAAYHQGTVWGWLIGPFIDAHLRVYKDPTAARTFLVALLQQMADHGIGSISEIFDGDAPFTPRGCIAQAWSVAEILRTLQLTQS